SRARPLRQASAFFFSSRRRHTRLQGDWSSDVCSSDLPGRRCRRRTTSLAWVGCVAYTPELATWFGDDIAFRGDSRQIDLAGLPKIGRASCRERVESPAGAGVSREKDARTTHKRSGQNA